MRLQATTDNLKASRDQVQQEREKQAILRTKLETIEESQNIDKQHILEIEQLLRKVVAFKSLDGKLSRVVSDNLENVRATIVLKHEKCVQSKQLQLIEQRYHTLSKGGVNGSYAREVGMLKGSIERERQDLQLLEKRVEE